MMEAQEYDWFIEALKISNINDRISFLQERILQLEEEYEVLCDRNMEIQNELIHLADSKIENNKEYFILKRRETEIQKLLDYARIEQTKINDFYTEQFKKFELENEFAKLPERKEEIKNPGRLLTTKEKLFLLELLDNHSALMPIRKRDSLEITLPLIMGIKRATLEGDLKEYNGWFDSKEKDTKEII